MPARDHHAEILHLFDAAARHLSKIDPELRDHIMQGARDVLMHPDRDYVEAFGSCLIAVPAGARGSFMATLENAARLAREIRRSGGLAYIAPTRDPGLRQGGGQPVARGRSRSTSCAT